VNDEPSRTELFWQRIRNHTASEMGSVTALTVAERLDVLRRMNGESARVRQNLVKLAETTGKFVEAVNAAEALANEILALDSENKLVPMSAGPINIDPSEWLRLASRLHREAVRAHGHLAEVTPDIVEQLATLAASDKPKPKPKR
jgi:hypothetical protein